MPAYILSNPAVTIGGERRWCNYPLISLIHPHPLHSALVSVLRLTLSCWEGGVKGSVNYSVFHYCSRCVTALCGVAPTDKRRCHNAEEIRHCENRRASFVTHPHRNNVVFQDYVFTYGNLNAKK